MASKFVSHAVLQFDGEADNEPMPRKSRVHLKPDRRPTFIRQWRKTRGLTLAAMADELQAQHSLEISEGQLSRVENGKSPYGQDLLEAIASVLQTEPASLIMRDPTNTEFWTTYDTLSLEQRQAVTDYADFIQRKAG